MVYGFVRLAFWALIFFVAYFWIVRKSKIVKKKRVLVIVLILCMLLSTVSSLFPVENVLIRFETPQEAHNYFRPGNIVNVVYGNGSSLVIYSTAPNSHSVVIFPRDRGGYVLPSLFSVRRIIQGQAGTPDSVLFNVYSVIGTDDYFITGLIILETDIAYIVDSNGNNVDFESIRMSDFLIVIYFFVESFSHDFYFLVNGYKISF